MQTKQVEKEVYKSVCPSVDLGLWYKRLVEDDDGERDS